ncbi:MAG: hypothetical protein FJX47_13265, partial [Alphaproteobacteria bacterium]|nr:hypothetical protein [Alphaproteobacteria bacterium]
MGDSRVVTRRRGAIRRGLSATLALGLGLGAVAAWAEAGGETPENLHTLGDYGGVGLLTTRTARMQPDGSFDLGASIAYPYLRYYLNWQFLPWLEATFRYSAVQNQFYVPGDPSRTTQTYKDRGADIKFRLWEEGQYRPQLAIGFQDTLGTGLFASEYIVASKRYFDFDFSIGLAWGYLGSRGGLKNPFSGLPGFDARQQSSAYGGSLGANAWFHGPEIGYFGGVEWRTPIEGFWLKAELDGNDYRHEPFQRTYDTNMPFNFGLVYRPVPYFESSIGVERGNTMMYRIALKTNYHTAGVPKTEPPPPVPRTREAVARAIARGIYLQEGADPRGPEQSLAEMLLDMIEGRGLSVENVSIIDNQMRLAVSGIAFPRDLPEIRRAAQTLAGPVPVAIDRVLPAVFGASGGAVDQGAIIDFLFDGLEGEGLRVVGFDVGDDSAVLTIEGSADAARRRLRQVGSLVVGSVPMPIRQVVIMGSDGGRLSVERDELRRNARIDRLFDEIEAQGFEIEEVDFSARSATITLAALGRATGIAPRVADIVAEGSPQPIDEVTILGARAGLVETRVTLHRRGRLWEPTGQPTDPFVPPLRGSDPATRKAVAQRLFKELEDDGFRVDGLHLEDRRATIYVQPKRYPQPGRNIGRAARALANNVPPEIEELVVVMVDSGVELGRTTLPRKEFERALARVGSPEEVLALSKSEGSGAKMPDGLLRNPGRYPSFDWGVAPRLRQHVGGGDQFYIYQIQGALEAKLEVAPGINIEGEYARDIHNTFDKIRSESDSKLPHVRSDITQYLKEGENSLSKLQGNYLFIPGTNLYGRASAGIFEEMFGGAGGEVLYRQIESRWAVAGNLYRVRQRDYDQRFAFRDYETTTGHATLYYKAPYQDIVVALSAGKYLARDQGATLRLSRRFDSGMEIGAWATKTNVSAEQFGEGSFDKGFFLRIPFDLFTAGNSTRRMGAFAFSPLTRDGGARLSVG